MEDVFKELTNLGSEGVLRAIEGYARWYLVSAIGWLIAGIGIAFAGYKIGKLKIDDADEWNAFIRYIAMGLIVFISVCIIMHNLSTIFAPEAYAIHKFIMDIKP